MTALVANLLDETAATKTASSNTYITRTRTQDLMTLLSQIMNLERGMAIQKITNHALNNISELKQAADDMRKSASKLLIGAIANVVLSAGGSVASGLGALKSYGHANKAGKTLNSKKTKTIQDNITDAGTEIGPARAFVADPKNATDTLGMAKHQGIIETQKELARKSNADLKQIHLSSDGELKMADAINTGFRSIMEFSRSAGHFAEALAQVDSKKAEADMAEKQANAQLEQGTKDMALQNLNAIKTMVEALLNAFKEIRDTQDQVKANIARNA